MNQAETTGLPLSFTWIGRYRSWGSRCSTSPTIRRICARWMTSSESVDAISLWWRNCGMLRGYFTLVQDLCDYLVITVQPIVFRKGRASVMRTRLIGTRCDKYCCKLSSLRVCFGLFSSNLRVLTSSVEISHAIEFQQ